MADKNQLKKVWAVTVELADGRVLSLDVEGALAESLLDVLVGDIPAGELQRFIEETPEYSMNDRVHDKLDAQMRQANGPVNDSTTNRIGFSGMDWTEEKPHEEKPKGGTLGNAPRFIPPPV